MTDVEMARQAVGRWKATAEALARDIWSYAELPYCETETAAALCGALEREGFSVETHVAGIPTCFTAVSATEPERRWWDCWRSLMPWMV